MDDRIDTLAGLVSAGGVVVLSGAGMSTDSGIPDYRGPSGTLHRRAPMTYREFVSDAAARRRYWARSQVGWRHMARAAPNAAHRAVAALERHGWLHGTITQNVDGLHQRAGSRDVIELHGSLATVVCLDCGARGSRRDLARRLRAANPDTDQHFSRIAPDGDADLSEDLVAHFTVVPCRRCRGGIVKPEVVFFGESVPRDRVAACFARVDVARTLLVLGSSLRVMSGYRFVIRARELGIAVAIVNRGATRGDADACVKIDAGLSDVLPALADRLGAGRPGDDRRATAG
ncbi:MAG TPA: NAD-dependent protein deacetylase [Euzebyales bacterium]|nr:NAD-dependent protein deacetylase [Euzebyales bacterium]